MNSTVLKPLVIKHAAATETVDGSCAVSNDFNGQTNLRILAVFMILISSGIGVYFPLLSSRYSFIRVPDWCFFVAKFFGSGVIVATAFIHLLEPASDALGNECLGGTFAEYPWAFGICLMSLFAMFFSEIVTHYFISKNSGHESGSDVHVHSHSHSHFGSNTTKESGDYPYREACQDEDCEEEESMEDTLSKKQWPYNVHNGHIDEETQSHSDDEGIAINSNNYVGGRPSMTISKLASVPGTNHYSHEVDHQDPSQVRTPVDEKEKEKYLNQVVAVTILEFGVIFHSVFVGLSLAVSGDEFKTLFVVLIFHQMFEGLGLGTRLAEAIWPREKWYLPWLMALGFTLTTPIAVAIGIGVRNSFVPGSRKALIANGVFDALSAGILVYTGLVELMAHEFLFSNQFKGPHGFRRMISAYLIMCCGAGLMALLGKWA